MSDTIDEDTKEKQKGISNFSIKVHILHSSVLLNSSILNSTKQKLVLSQILSMLNTSKYDPHSCLYSTKPEKNQYLASFSPVDQFTTNVKSVNKDNNAVAMIERFFINIRHKSFYKRLTEKVIHETCKFFMHSTIHMTSKDCVVFYEIRSGLSPF